MDLISYIRVSTDEQARGGHSLDVQDRNITTAARLHGYRITKLIPDEGVSASRPLEKRRGGAQLLAMLRTNRARGVIVTRLDRLFRDTLDGLQFFREAVDNDWVVHSVSELVDTSTPHGRLSLSIMLATAQFERDMASVRNLDVARSLRRNGRAWGHIPYGFIRDATGNLRRCPVAWPAREMIVRLRQQQGVTWPGICKALRDHGVTSPGGRRVWAESTVRGIVESHHAVEHIDADDGANEAQVSPAVVAGQGTAPATQRPVT